MDSLAKEGLKIAKSTVLSAVGEAYPPKLAALAPVGKFKNPNT
jgi:hypothetical protein